jgi:xanthine dehydrogenase YagT iron-sulfur-binding subunit
MSPFVTSEQFQDAYGCPSYASRLKEFKMDLSTLAEDLAGSIPYLQSIPITLTINGKIRQLSVEPWVTLLDLLREREDLTGTKKGCDHGQCGACTVLIDGKRINSCLRLAVAADGAEITTIEGLGSENAPHALQQAFMDHDAFQCGYCTPGQICSAQGLINEGHAHSREEIREAMSGNLCRCGAYTNITDAVVDVLTRERGQ